MSFICKNLRTDDGQGLWYCCHAYRYCDACHGIDIITCEEYDISDEELIIMSTNLYHELRYLGDVIRVTKTHITVKKCDPTRLTAIIDGVIRYRFKINNNVAIRMGQHNVIYCIVDESYDDFNAIPIDKSKHVVVRSEVYLIDDSMLFE